MKVPSYEGTNRLQACTFAKKMNSFIGIFQGL